ncbi:MAG: ABC-type transport auxiliary lipoprotein family protein [Nitrospira sp.]|nr:ABC-type transport auxiliary lipoprotein family protein [Nitrospira sp.]MCP9443490.1 ABC-type transport auxiliary lipoprotein family protein [Nitrospira sp.]
MMTEGGRGVGTMKAGIGKGHQNMVKGERSPSIAWRMGYAIGCAWLVLVLSGCVMPQTASEPARTYRLSLDQSREARRSAADAPILLVGTPQAEPGYDTTKMAYVKRAYEIEYYAVNQWTEQPTRMFGSLLIQSLEATGLWRAVVPWPSAIHGDLRLDSYGFAIQQEFTQDPSVVRVKVRTQLVDVKESKVLGTRSFERVEPAPTQDAYGGVVAANRATAAMLDDIASWLNTCLQRLQTCGR